MTKEANFYMGKNVVITGASSGIGLALTERFYQYGARLYLIDINQESLNRLQSRFHDKNRVSFFCQDVCDRGAMVSLRSRLPDTIDLVVANAGLGGLNPTDHFSYDIFDRMLQVNFVGMINTLMPFVSSMIEKKNGHLVGVSSLAGFRGLANASSYSSSKAAQKVFLESMRVDLKKYGVSVSSIHPGFVHTAMTDHNEFAMPFSVSAEKAAALMTRAIFKRKALYLFPFPMKIMTMINRLLPCWAFDFVMSFVGKDKKEAKIF